VYSPETISAGGALQGQPTLKASECEAKRVVGKRINSSPVGATQKENIFATNLKKKARTSSAAKSKRSSQSPVQFFAQSPLANADINLERTPDYGRELKLFSGLTQRRRRGSSGEN
jgi:hypothetical protein